MPEGYGKAREALDYVLCNWTRCLIPRAEYDTQFARAEGVVGNESSGADPDHDSDGVLKEKGENAAAKLRPYGRKDLFTCPQLPHSIGM